MAYAIIQSGGKQFRVAEGEVVRLPFFESKVGSTVHLDVLAKGDTHGIEVGSPLIESKVAGTVLSHGRGPKVIVFKKKRRKQYKKTHGHRQAFTAVLINSLAATAGDDQQDAAPSVGASEVVAADEDHESEAGGNGQDE